MISIIYTVLQTPNEDSIEGNMTPSRVYAQSRVNTENPQTTHV